MHQTPSLVDGKVTVAMLSGPCRRRSAWPVCSRIGRLTFEPTTCPRAPSYCHCRSRPRAGVSCSSWPPLPSPSAGQRQHHVLSDSGKYCARSASRCTRPNFRVSGAGDRLGPGSHFKCAPARGAGGIGDFQYLHVISAHPRHAESAGYRKIFRHQYRSFQETAM